VRSGRTQEQINNLAHRHYVAWATGDGAKTEFFLPKSVERIDDLTVTIGGAVKRPSVAGVVYDYDVRGITPGYAGESNVVRFAAAPAAAVNIGFFLNAN
jgi:hypothetical protein